MEFRQLEAFVNAVKYKSFSKAAELQTPSKSFQMETYREDSLIHWPKQLREHIMSL